MESYQYSYDKNSNIIEKIAVNNYPKEDSDKVNETKAYTYDTLGRLTKTVTYTYDNVGNRLKEDDGTTTISYTYNGLDQLKTSTKEKGTAVEEVRQYDYDANGNQNSQNLIGTDGNVLATESNTILSLQQRYPGKYKQSGKRRWKCGCDLPVYGFWRDNDPG